MFIRSLIIQCKEYFSLDYIDYIIFVFLEYSSSEDPELVIISLEILEYIIKFMKNSFKSKIEPLVI
jgi:hypothetical protein